MPRWLWWAPFWLLLLGFALLWLRYGWRVASITETDVINHYAERYVEERGGDASVTDCVADPGRAFAGIWLVVSCTPKGAVAGDSVDYFVNRLGGLENMGKPGGETPLGPRT
ncbi:hypothetical protein AB2B41_05960 [Marimonas sp. MJW-29]|uniref:Uncharacterized protein n=1 Tax=Sulfitobacter sediminis TaxID=3234186 RepID=A0ABV3RJH4_9RHOB